MVFKNDRQRKAVMASMNEGQPKANVSPSIVARATAALRKRREEKGKARIEAEKRALKVEQLQAKRLRQELEVEQAREAVAQQRRETQAEFRKIERERALRTRRGQAAELVRRGVRAGAAAARAAAVKRFKQARRKPRRRRRRPPERVGAFGI